MLAVDKTVPGSVVQLLSIDECELALQELYSYWDRLRGERSMPARRDFDPADVRTLLPHLILVDVNTDAPRETRYRVRLHGTAQVSYQGIDWTGFHPHDKTDKASAERLCDVGDYIVSHREPWISTGKLYWMPSKPFYRFQTVLLPLSDDEVTVNMILGLTIFF